MSLYQTQLKCKWMFQKLALWRNLFNRLFCWCPKISDKKRNPRNSIKVIPARSGTNLIFQLTGVPSRKEASNRGLWILRHAGPSRRNTERLLHPVTCEKIATAWHEPVSKQTNKQTALFYWAQETQHNSILEWKVGGGIRFFIAVLLTEAIAVRTSNGPCCCCCYWGGGGCTFWAPKWWMTS